MSEPFMYKVSPELISYLQRRLRESPYAGGGKKAPSWMRNMGSLSDSLKKCARGGKKKAKTMRKKKKVGMRRKKPMKRGGVLIGGCCPYCQRVVTRGGMNASGMKKPMMSMALKKLLSKVKTMRKKGGVGIGGKKMGVNTHAMKVKKVMAEYKKAGRPISLGEASKMASRM